MTEQITYPSGWFEPPEPTHHPDCPAEKDTTAKCRCEEIIEADLVFYSEMNEDR